MADYNAKIMNQGVMTGTSTIYSDKFSLKKGSMFSLHFVYAGSTPTGTLTLWASNKPSPDADSVTDWVENTDVTFTAIAGDSAQFINAGNAAARYYMVRYVNASGTGNIDCWINAGEA